MTRPLTVKERLAYIWRIVSRTLNKNGRYKFYRDFFVNNMVSPGKPTHEKLDFLDWKLFQLLREEKHEKEGDHEY